MSDVSSDNKRSDDYWMGVRDALRMVDSFNKWAVRNPGKAKSLEDFIHDGLIAAAKRCESCLREKLGLSFGRGATTNDVQDIPESYLSEVTPPPDSIAEENLDEIPDLSTETTFDVSVESVDSEISYDIAIETEESSPSIDSVERLEDESIDEIALEGPTRDFSTDFDLPEPSPLMVDTEESEPEEIETVESLDDSQLVDMEESESSFSDNDESETRPSFTWSDYESAVTPASDTEPLDDSEEEETIEPVEVPTEPPILPEDAIEPEPTISDAKEVWRSYDESTSTGDDDISSEEVESEEPESSRLITEPPEPPAPPEDEEDEEERRRRARRLFFGT